MSITVAAGRPAPPRLVTERLILRAHEAADLAACAELWSDPVVTASIGGQAFSPDAIWQRILRYAGLWQILGYGYWAITDRADGRFIGEAGLADFRRDMSPPLGSVPEAGWALHSSVHKRGLALEAMQAILGWADTSLGAAQTCCIISPANTASITLASRLGYLASHDSALGGHEVTVYHRPSAAMAAAERAADTKRAAPADQ
tara:strand:+ start:12093 stop:12701 length:609 start_codon:yes stop_codon:yes gene_type:complete